MTDRKLSDLMPDQELEGTVTKTELYGAFVDVGAERDGLVHISMLQKGNVKRVEDVVETGQKVKVWVHRIDPEEGRLELSMVQPVAVKWKDIKPGMSFDGKVVRLENYGAFIDIGGERPGLVHISEMSTDYVRQPGDVVSVGDKVDVRVLEVDRKKRRIRLTMKPETVVEEEVEPEPEEQMPTAMEVALRRAMEANDQPDEAFDGAGHQPKQDRQEQEDILLRTLKHRMKTQSSRGE